MLKNWCFWIVVLEKILESPVDWKEIKLLNPKGNQSWIFIGRNDAEAPILWRSDGKKRLIGKVPDAGKDWGQKEREWQKMRWLNSLTDWTDMNLSKLLEIVEGGGVWQSPGVAPYLKLLHLFSQFSSLIVTFSCGSSTLDVSFSVRLLATACLKHTQNRNISFTLTFITSALLLYLLL